VRRSTEVVGFALVVAALAGCIIGRDYGGPITSNNAYINAASMNGGIINAFIFDEAENCVSRRRIKESPLWTKTPAQQRDGVTFVAVDAGKPVSVAIFLSDPGASIAYEKYCTPILSFTPEVGRYYRVLLSRGEESCNATLASTDSAVSINLRREGFRRMILRVPHIDETGPFCRPGEYVSP